jgi:O-antigen/teichoic acid export membrane protein/glycosyltransferase involved in cell wall biosynthesis
VSDGRTLARNSALNFIGLVLPMLVAIAAIPMLVRGLGAERFGILTLAWAAIGYFSLFELGLSRALTQRVAQQLTNGGRGELAAATWSALVLLLGLGIAGALLFGALTPALVTRLLNVPVELHQETRTSFYILAASLPFVVTTAGLRGLMEAHQHFGMVAALRVPLIAFTFIGPLLVLPFSRSLVPAVAMLAAGRVVGWLAHVVYCARRYPFLRARVAVDRAQLRPLLHFGGWTTVTNVVSPMMVYLDRFAIGALLPMAAVAHYVTPYELVTKFLVIPGALLSAMFPALAASAAGDGTRLHQLYERAVRALLLLMFPVILVCVALAREGLALWLGPTWPHESAIVLQWLAVGVFVNALGQAPYSALQGAGRPDAIAKLHLVELPLYVAAIYILVRELGLTGVAAAVGVLGRDDDRRHRGQRPAPLNRLATCLRGRRAAALSPRRVAHSVDDVRAPVAARLDSIPQNVHRRGGGSGMSMGSPRVLIVHEWFYTWAGSERALEQIIAVFPDADLLVGVMTRRMRDYNAVTRRAEESWLGRLPGARNHHRWFLPLQALAFATHDTRGYDLVISSSHAFGKFIRPRPGAIHVCYCYSPPRYLWDMQQVYENNSSAGERSALHLAAPVLRRLDRLAVRGVDRFVSISRYVSDRVRRCYGRESDVVYPPVAHRGLSDETRSARAGPYLLYLGRLVPYKRVDLVIRAAEQLRMPLVIAGDGPERSRLESLANGSTTFLGEVDETTAAELLNGCTAFVFAGEEDFGIALVEANAHGKPVVAYGRGGALETMIPEVSATLFDEQTVESVAAAITRSVSRSWDGAALRANAARFAPERFREAFADVVARAIDGHREAAA